MQDQDQDDYTGVVTAAMMWDMLPASVVIPLCPEAGIIPPDAEGAAFEKAASDARRSHIASLLPWIEVLSVIAAEISGIVAVRPASQVPSPAELNAVRQVRDTYEMNAHDLICPSACAIISLLAERGFIAVTDRGRNATLDAFLGG